MTHMRMLFVVLFLLCPMILLVSCATQSTRTTSGWPGDTTTYGQTRGGAIDTLQRAATAQLSAWPPDTVSLTPVGQGMLMVSTGHRPVATTGRSVTFHVAEQPSATMANGGTADRFRTMLTETTSEPNQGSLLFVKESDDYTSNRDRLSEAAGITSHPEWPPDTTSLTFDGQGVIRISSQPVPGFPKGLSATYRLVSSEQTQGGQQNVGAVDRFRSLLMEQPASTGQESLLLIKAPGEMK